MKGTLKRLFESFFRLSLVRALVRAMIHVVDLLGRFWTFVKIRAVADIPRGSNCHWSVVLKYPENIKFHGRVMISPDCVIGAKSPVHLGNEVRLSQGVHIETASLDINGPLPYQHVSKPVCIEDGVWLGAHCIVLAGVTIGRNSVIGAGVVVSKSVPENSIVVGSGFRFIERKESY
ncbi:acyltransferase [Pseudomonas sp. B21-012]|uniref:acyltransferase n=1 Tax=unclassified Pseudomonas TaxID=196821 RepID=UPI00201B7DD8|nr:MULTISPECIES: acyltransferase [unclassified Pseudomonas]UVL55014.1 acyltransferase [Pseudomonas sp. B21-035]UVM54579.1 acyltransferase [Pseudomonas sp. B21-012]